MEQDDDAGVVAERPSRRAFVAAGAGVLAASLVPRASQAQGGRTPISLVVERLSQRAEWKRIDLRLIRRVTLGMTEADVTLMSQMGFAQYLEWQLNADAIDDSAADAQIQFRYPQFYYTQAQMLANDSVFWQQIAAPAQRAVIERAIISRRQLKERMVEFWADHFNISLSGPRVVDYRDVIRQNALGKFGDLLRASMRSPAMLIYLDQVWSTKWGVNENYARELMELHTLGWNGGYTQHDVHELARVLTGWTIDGNRNFQYRADYHDFGAKTVMGMTFPARPEASGTAGMDEGMAFADYLVNHPSTARFIATKLLKWFITPTPSTRQVSAVAAAYTATGGDIKAMLRVVLSQNNLANAPAKLKRPFHYYVSTVRCSGATIAAWSNWSQWEGVTGAMWDMAHGVFAWPTPDGFPDRAEYWAGLMVNRWNAVSGILSNWGSVGQFPRFSIAPFMTTPTETGVVDAINRKMFGGEMSAALRAELLNWLNSNVLTQASAQAAVYFAAASPDFQYY
ncbi:MAG: DUF1800 domain-containing protein [Gemmatimonadaceae bacterium]